MEKKTVPVHIAAKTPPVSIVHFPDSRPIKPRRRLSGDQIDLAMRLAKEGLESDSAIQSEFMFRMICGAALVNEPYENSEEAMEKVTLKKKLMAVLDVLDVPSVIWIACLCLYPYAVVCL